MTSRRSQRHDLTRCVPAPARASGESRLVRTPAGCSSPSRRGSSTASRCTWWGAFLPSVRGGCWPRGGRDPTPGDARAGSNVDEGALALATTPKTCVGAPRCKLGARIGLAAPPHWADVLTDACARHDVVQVPGVGQSKADRGRARRARHLPVRRLLWRAFQGSCFGFGHDAGAVAPQSPPRSVLLPVCFRPRPPHAVPPSRPPLPPRTSAGMQ